MKQAMPAISRLSGWHAGVIVLAAIVLALPSTIPQGSAEAAALCSGPPTETCDLPSIGGYGGGSFRAECPKGYYLLGVETHSGSYVDWVKGYCQLFDGSGAAKETKGYGGTGGNIYPAQCRAPFSQMAVSIAVEGGELKFVRNIQLYCTGIKPDCAGYGGHNCLDVSGDKNKTQNCPKGMVATGIKGRYGKYVDAIGLICGLKPGVKLPSSQFCQNYASLAFDQAIAAAKSPPECGFTGGRWTTNKQAHLDWCDSLKGDEKPAMAESGARSQGLLNCSKIVEAKKAGENKYTPPPLPPGTLQGVWDTQTGEGQKYTLIILPQGGSLSVSFGASDAKLDGTMQTSFFLEQKKMNFVLTQPKIGATSRGSIQLTDDNHFTGSMTKDGGGELTWTGTRRN